MNEQQQQISVINIKMEEQDHSNIPNLLGEMNIACPVIALAIKRYVQKYPDLSPNERTELGNKTAAIIDQNLYEIGCKQNHLENYGTTLPTSYGGLWLLKMNQYLQD